MLYLGVPEWTAPQIEAALRIAAELGLRNRIVANQPQYNMLWRVIEPQVLPLCEPAAGPGRAHRQVPARPAAAGELARHQRRADAPVHRPGAARSRTAATSARRGRRPLDGPARGGWTLQTDGVSSAIIGASRPEQVTENALAAGVQLLAKIDEVLGDLIDRDPAKTAQMMSVKPAWNRPA
ncbi:aldo/keto reductase [Actinoplanes sp. CA-051413]|uniref:aldo/keto reductase n=1 Tax=Actinoplanes sp. CA-051413 TaxID=3239899 RepID=UPI003D98989C